MASPNNRLRALRRSRGLTLKALAQRAGTTNQQISNLELGRRRLTVDWLMRLARALGASPANFSPPLVGADNDEESELVMLFRGLDRHGRDAVLGLAGLLGDAGAGDKARPIEGPG